MLDNVDALDTRCVRVIVLRVIYLIALLSIIPTSHDFIFLNIETFLLLTVGIVSGASELYSSDGLLSLVIGEIELMCSTGQVKIVSLPLFVLITLTYSFLPWVNQSTIFAGGFDFGFL